MNAVRQLREASKSGTAMNESMRRYREVSGTYLSQSDVTFAHLAVHYLQWTAELLAKLERAAEARPAAAASVEICKGRIGAYFNAPERWPAVDRLDHPMRLLIPAYYAMRAVQWTSGHSNPPLLGLSCEEPHAVFVALLGRAACQEVSEHKNADLRILPKVVEPAGDHRPILVRKFPSDAERAAFDAARAGRAPRPVPSPP